jgi:PhnB protein
MSSRLNPYISFSGNARQAMEYYHSVLGGQLALSTYGETGAGGTPFADQIMHGMLETDKGFTLMCSDMPPGTELKPGNNMAVSLSGDHSDDLRGTGRSCPTGARSRWLLSGRCGAMCLVCAPTGSVSAGW